MKAKIALAGAILLAGIGAAAAQGSPSPAASPDNPPGARFENRGNAEENVGQDPFKSRAQETQSGATTSAPAGSRTQTERQNESMGTPPSGGR